MDGINTPTAAPKADLSKTTLVVLVLLTLVISVVGTWSVLNEVNGLQLQSRSQGPSQASAQVGLTIAQPAEPVVTTGKVTFNIVQ